MAGYIGPIPVPQATQTRETFTATASQATFNTGGYTPGFIDVFMNGVKLASADFTATNGSDVVLATGAAVNDIIEVVAYTAFEVLNQNFTGNTSTQDLTVSGNLTVTGTTITIDTATAQNVDLGDGDKIRLGDGDDLQIYHDGSNSYVDDTGTGRLYLRGNDRVQIQKYTGEDMVTALADGAVNLYYNNSKKFETTATGVDITGNTIAKGYFASEATNSTNKWLAYTHTDNTFRLNYNGAGADEVTITSSGDFLIGSTSVIDAGAGTQDGFSFSAGDRADFSRNNNPPLDLRRRSSDGAIVNLYRDTTHVGSIASRSGTTASFVGYTGSGVGAGVAASTNMIIPSNETGAHQDNRISLGSGATRWKDIYVSGGIYFQGSTTANQLDGYEEGTWTPVIDATSGSSPTVTFASGDVALGYYTKVGRVVHVSFYIPNFTVSGTTSGNIAITGLPYASASIMANGATVAHYNVTWARTRVALKVFSGTKLAFLSMNNGGTWGWEVLSALSGGGARYLESSITYTT